MTENSLLGWSDIISQNAEKIKPPELSLSGITFTVQARGGLWQIVWDGFESQWLDSDQLVAMLRHFGLQLQSAPERKNEFAYKQFQHKVFKTAKVPKKNAPRDLDLEDLDL